MLPRPVLMDSVLKSANHADVKREMASLASEKMRLLGAQIAKIEKFKCVPLANLTLTPVASWLVVSCLRDLCRGPILGLAVWRLRGWEDKTIELPTVPTSFHDLIRKKWKNACAA